MDDAPTEQLFDEVERVRQEASSSVMHGASHSALHAVLAHTLAIVERVILAPALEADLRAEISQRSEPGRRVYVERASDAFAVVTRYVFSCSTRANISRYTLALRAAYSRQIRAPELPAYLADHGGVNGLWLERAETSERVRISVLRLETFISVPRRGAFSLTIERTSGGTFSILENSNG